MKEAYLEKERKRIRGYYVAIEERSKKEPEKRRNKVRRHVKQHRQMKKDHKKLMLFNL